MYRYPFILIPIQLSEYVYRNGLIYPFRTFLTLKMIAGDRASCGRQELVKTKESLGYKSMKTIKAHINHLIGLGWIESRNGYNILTGIDRIMELYDLQASTSTFYYPEDSNTFKEYLFGSIVGAAVNHTKKKGREQAHIKGRGYYPSSADVSSRPPYFGMALSQIALKLNCSKSTAWANLNKAEQAGYLLVKRKRYAKYFSNSLEAKNYQRIQNESIYQKAVCSKTKSGRYKVSTNCMNEILPLMTFKSKHSLRGRWKKPETEEELRSKLMTYHRNMILN